MAQLRHDYQEFKALNTEVLVIVPNGPRMIEKHVTETGTRYSILSDKGSTVAEQYGIKTKTVPLIDFTHFKPAVFLVDRAGKVIYSNYLASYTKNPENKDPLTVLVQTTV